MGAICSAAFKWYTRGHSFIGYKEFPERSKCDIFTKALKDLRSSFF